MKPQQECMGRMIPLAEVKHIQGKVSKAQYDRIRRAAKKEGMSLQDFVGWAVNQAALTALDESPWDAFIGCIDDGPEDAALNVDDIYLVD